MAVSQVRSRSARAEAVASIEQSVVTIIRELSLASVKDALISQTGVSLERAGFGVLRRVAAGGELRVSDLAQSLGVDTSTMSRHVKSLERDGFLERTGDPADRRVAIVSLTPSGADALELLRAARHRFFDEIMDDWSERDREVLAPLLARFATDVLAKAGRE